MDIEPNGVKTCIYRKIQRHFYDLSKETATKLILSTKSSSNNIISNKTSSSIKISTEIASF